MPDHRLEAPSAIGLPPPSELIVDLQVQAGDRVILVVGFDQEFVYHYDDGRLLRAHVPTDCWCGDQRTYRGSPCPC